MKKKIIAGSVVLLALALTSAYFIPVTDQKEVLIFSHILYPVRELNSAGEWIKWNPALKQLCAENPQACSVTQNTAKEGFTIQSRQNTITVQGHMISFDISQTSGGHTSRYNYSLASSLHDDSTKLIVTEKKSLLQSWLPQLAGNSPALTDADSLKYFIETPSAYYGFPLEITETIDTNVVMMYKTVPVVNQAGELKNMYNAIYKFIKYNYLKVLQPPIVHYKQTGKDSVNIMAGIAVDKRVGGNKSITCLQMPHGRMLTGYYKGKFGSRMKLYQAMDRFIINKSMKVIAVPYEKYLNNVLPENDDTQVEIRIYYPVL